MNAEIDGTVEINTAGTYKYSSDYFLYGSTLSISGTGDVLLYLYGCVGEINIYSTKTSGYLKVYAYGFKGLFGINCADNSHVPRVYIYGGEMLISNSGKIQVLQVESAISRLVSGGTIDNYLNNSKMPASIAAGDIAADAITAASVKADAVTKIQANLALGTNLETVRLGVVDVKAYLVSPVQEFLTAILSAVGESDFERSVMSIVEELLFTYHVRIREAIDVHLYGDYDYYNTYFEDSGSLNIADDAEVVNPVINIYGGRGKLNIISTKTTGNLTINLFDFKGLFKPNLANSGSILVNCYGCLGVIENVGRITALYLNVSPMYVYGGTISTTTKIGRFDAAIGANDIGNDAINALSIKADAVTKIQSGLATPTNITAGTITTVTNLTNAPTAGDLTATMKASIAVAVWDELLSVARVAGSFGAKIKAWVLGTDNKSLISTDAQDLSATLDVNAKKLNGDVPPTGGASQEYLETVKADTVLLKQKIGITV
jgi:hypothetical protein